MPEMTSKQRVKTTFAHREPDRVPYFEIYIADRPRTALLGKPPTDGAATLREDFRRIREGDRDGVVRDRIRDILAVHRLLGYDLINVHPTYGAKPAIPEEIEPNTWRHEVGGGFWSIMKWDKGPDVLFPIDSNIQREGIPGFRRLVEMMESFPSDPDLSVFDPLVYVKEHESQMFILGDADVTCPTIGPWVPVYLEALNEAPDVVERYMELTIEKEFKGLQYQLSLGVDGVIGRNDWYGKHGPFMSPAQFRHFIMPYLKRIVDECHKHGVPFIKHLDGNTMLTAQELWVELGIDGYHAIEGTAGMDIGEMKTKFGDRLVLLGNIDCGQTMTYGTKEEIVAEAKDILRKAAPGGGFVFSSSNSIHGHVPIQNVHTAIDTVKEFGIYPIRV